MKEKKDLRIAINELGGAQWTGGITYRNNLLKALKLLGMQDNIVCLSSDPTSKLDPAFKIIPLQQPAGTMNALETAVLKKVFKFDFPLYKTVQKENIDVLFPHTLAIGKNRAVIYWIPDFQFMHLPHLYTAAHVANNKIKLNRYFNEADLIVVSSEDALEDFKNYSPQFVQKVRVMSFVAHVPENLYEDDPSSILEKYHLPEEFIYLPNQFWSHKNHSLVFEALHLLRQEGVYPFIVCSGNPTDIRDPSHLANLLQKISEYGIREQVAFVGMVPHEHVYSLIRQSKCVLNPSLFEGWSTSVEEAKSVGKRMVLSNLGVHFEQAPADSIYFDRYSAVELAATLKKAWLEFSAGPDLKLESAARMNLKKRMETFGERFLDICLEAVSKKSKNN